MVDFGELRAQFRDEPLLTALDASLLFGGMALSITTSLILVGGLSERFRPLWFGVIVLGVGVVLVANVLYPLLDRYHLSSKQSSEPEDDD